MNYEVNVTDRNGDRKRYLISSNEDCFIDEDTGMLTIWYNSNENVYYNINNIIYWSVRKIDYKDYDHSIAFLEDVDERLNN